MQPYSLEFRQRIIDTYAEGNTSQRKLAQRFRVAPSFVQKILKQYREIGSIEPKQRLEQTPTKLNSAQLYILKKIVAANNDATLAELCDLLLQETNIRVGVSTMFRMLKKQDLTLKKTLHPSEKETEQVQIQRCEFWQIMPALLAQDLIFIDETGVDLALTRLGARSPRGSRARGKRPSKRGKRVSIISAINLKEVMAHCQLRGTTDGLAFEAFIAQKLVPKLWKGACVIMDNCSIHKGKEIKALIEAAGAILIYLPPYSPDFSPIEN
jgi:transposase